MPSSTATPIGRTSASREGVLYLNPGRAGPRRFKLPITVATLEISAGTVRPRIHEISV